MCRISYVLICSGRGEMGRGEVEFMKFKLEIAMTLLLFVHGVS